QRVAVDAKHRRGRALVAFGLAEHRLDERPLDVPKHHVVDLGRLLAVHVAEVALQRPLYRVGELVVAAHPGSSSSRPSKKRPTAASCSAELPSAIASRRNASPPGSGRTYQPMCLRAMRTPSSSP